jgi:hypothetical protein
LVIPHELLGWKTRHGVPFKRGLSGVFSGCSQEESRKSDSAGLKNRDQILLYFRGKRQSPDLADGLLYWIAVGLQRKLAVLSNGVGGSAGAIARLANAFGVEDHRVADATHEGNMRMSHKQHLSPSGLDLSDPALGLGGMMAVQWIGRSCMYQKESGALPPYCGVERQALDEDLLLIIEN